MASSEARLQANNKYKREKVYRLGLEFYPTDQELIDKLKSVPSMQRYIKDLIRADIKREEDTN